MCACHPKIRNRESDSRHYHCRKELYTNKLVQYREDVIRPSERLAQKYSSSGIPEG